MNEHEGMTTLLSADSQWVRLADGSYLNMANIASIEANTGGFRLTTVSGSEFYLFEEPAAAVLAWLDRQCGDE